MKRRILAIAAAVAVVVRSPASAQTPDDVERYVWDLSPLYASGAAWDAERREVERKLKTIGRFRGKLARDATTFEAAIEAVTDLRARAANLEEYGILVSNLDVSSRAARSQNDRATALAARVESAVSFADGEIARLGATRVAQFVRERPMLAAEGPRLHRILVGSTHQLRPDTEMVVRGLVPPSQIASDTFRALHDAHVWSRVRAGTDIVDADLEHYRRLRSSGDLAVRSALDTAYLGTLRSYEDVFGGLLTRRIQSELILARQRRFRDGIEALLFAEGMPRAALDRLLAVARENVPTLHRYLALRARVVGVTGSYADSFVSPPSLARRFTVADTIAVTVGGAAVLGRPYTERLRRELATPWIHLPPWPQKRDTYGNWGNDIAGKPTFGFMKYDGSYRSSANFAGLAVARMAKATMPRDRPTDTRVDPGIYGNALVFSGNLLHNDYLRSHAVDRGERIAYLIYGLDRLRQVLFDEAMTMDYQAQIQAMLIAGRRPTGSEISAIYLRTLRAYRADTALGLTVDGAFAADWMSDDLPFDSFEDANFPLAMAAACLLVERARAGDANARRGFSAVRGRIGSDFSYDLLKAARIDLATSAPYEAAVRRMNALIAELDALVPSQP